MTFADDMWEHERAFDCAESRLFHDLDKIVELLNITHDSYDRSIELYSNHDMPETLPAYLKSLGFDALWWHKGHAERFSDGKSCACQNIKL